MRYGGLTETRLPTHILGDPFLFIIEFSFAKYISTYFGTKPKVQQLQVLANFISSTADGEIKRELFLSGITSNK